MALSSWFRSVRRYFQPLNSRQAQVRSHFFRPELERLEERLPPTVTFSISNPAPFPEGSSGTSNMIFAVTRSGDTAPAAQVDFQTVNGTAIAGTDYVATSGTLSFAAGQTTATISVPVIGGNPSGPNKTFTVALTNPIEQATFASATNFAVGTGPFSVTVADVNGDGLPDLIIANRTSNNVSVLINTTAPGATTPTFAAAATFVVGSSPTSVTVADLNGDGRPDLIVANSGSNNVSVLLNTTAPGAATPTFAAAVNFYDTAGPYRVTAADLNGDGRPDLAIANMNSTVSVLLNKTAAGAAIPSFAARVNFSAGGQCYDLMATDINGDGRPDLVATNYDTNNIAVLLNTTPAGAAAPTFAAAVTFAAGGRPTRVTAADFNGDGRPDLAVDDSSTGNISVLLNTTAAGAATPNFAAAVSVYDGQAENVATADFNGDGRPDLVATNESTHNVSVLLNTTAPGAATPTFSTAINFDTGTHPYSVTAADFNGDGLPDLAVANSSSNNVSVLLNTTATVTVSPSLASASNSGAGTKPISVTVADINGDGLPDLIVANHSSNSISVLLNTTTPGATTPSFTVQQTFAVQTPYNVTAVDLNGDGRPDLIVADVNYATVSVLLNTTAAGATSPSFAAAVTFGTGSGPANVTAADLNGDGRPDLIVANASSNNLSVLLNTTAAGATTPSFAAQQTFAAGGFFPRIVATADINGDGRPDIVVADTQSSYVAVLLNTTAAGATTASFGTAGTFAVGSHPFGLTVADFNGDGRPDLAVADQHANNVSVLLNTTVVGASTPSFAAAVTFATGTNPNDVTAVDVNGDGRPDLVVANYSSNNVSVLLNTMAAGATTPAFAAGVTFGTSTNPVRVAVADFNGDGQPDLAVANYNSANVSVLLNTAVKFTISGSPATGTIVDNLSTTSTWDGGGSDNNWTTAANWVGDVAPVAGNDIVFIGSVGLTPNNNFAAGTSFNSITFNSAGFTVSGNAIDLGAGGISMTATGTDTLGTGLNSAATQTFDVATGGLLTLTGVLSGAGINATGVGILVLGGTNTYTGATNVNGGTLLVNGALAAGAGTTTVSAGSVLGGQGSATAIAVNSGGTVNSGANSILSTGNVTLSSGSTFTVALNGATAGNGFGQLNVTGTVNLGGATLSPSLGFTPANGTQFTIINNDGTDAVTGTFAGLAQGAIFSVSGRMFQISYLGGTGNDVVLTAIQAPAFTSSNAATFTVGMMGSFLATASGFPTAITFSEAGTLPSGVSFNAATGVLSGIPASGTAGTYSFTISASNGVSPNAAQNFLLTVSNPSTITEISNGITANSQPTNIVKGPDGNFWFTETNTDSIARITPTGVITEFSAGITPGSQPTGITVGPDGNLWFTEQNGNRIGRITATGVVTEFVVGITPNSAPAGIAAGPDGNLWFTEKSANKIGMITITGAVTEIGGLTAGPTGITTGSDGNLWFTEPSGSRLGSINPTTHVVTEVTKGITPGSQPTDITKGPDGNLWFTEKSASQIGQVTTAGTVTEFSTGITVGSQPTGITTGTDGNLWFTEPNGSRLGRITPTGHVTEFNTGITPGSQPVGITPSTDGSLWFTEQNSSQIGKILPPAYLATGSDVGGAAAVQVIDANTGVIKFDFLAFPNAPTFTGGVRVAVGDVNGDGTPDIIIAPGKGTIGPSVDIFDGNSTGLTPTALASFQPFGKTYNGGIYVATGNFLGNGQEQVVCAEDTGGAVAIFNIVGSTATQLTSPLGRFFPYGTAFTGGVTVAAGNVEGNPSLPNVRTDDVVTGEAKGAALVRVYATDVTNKKLVEKASFLAYASTFTGGVSVAVGNLNSDGKADILTGSGPGLKTGAEVKAFDASKIIGFVKGTLETPTPINGTTIDFKPYGTSFTGGVRVALLDLDGNGLIDDIVTAPATLQNQNRVLLFDLTEAPVGAFFAYGTIYNGGVFIGG